MLLKKLIMKLLKMILFKMRQLKKKLLKMKQLKKKLLKMKQLKKKLLKMKLSEPVRKQYGQYRNYLLSRGKVKYFCIGRNKTGTTSIRQAFLDLGFPVGDQRVAEILYDRHYFSGEFQPIIDYCDTAQVFKDAPFSCPETFKHMDRAWPESKFILSVRDNAEQWYNSLVRYHSRRFGRVPTAEDLKGEKYPGSGIRMNVMRLHGTPEHDPYNKEIMTRHYNNHNASVIEYFKDRPGDLLVINVAEPDSWPRFLEFIGAKSDKTAFPWKNKT